MELLVVLIIVGILFLGFIFSLWTTLSKKESEQSDDTGGGGS